MTRWLPDGLAARFTLLLACALIMANVLALLVLSGERARWGRESRDSRELERIIALVPVLESIEPGRRAVIAASASTRVARVEMSDRPLIVETADTKRSRSLQEQLNQSLAPRDVFVMVGNRQQPGSRQGGERRDRDHRPQKKPGPEIIGVSIRLASVNGSARRATPNTAIRPESAHASWLNITAKGEPALPGAASQLLEDGVFFLILGLSLVSVLAVGLWFVRRLTQPLALLAEAAQAAGRGDRTARVPEQGAREVRAAASAFNSMQAQIARFDAERTRTLGAVGHDLRTPITSLRIRAEMLDDEFREPMVRTLEEMTVMANDLVAFARGNDDGEKLQSFDLNETLVHLCKERGANYLAGGAIQFKGRPVALIRAVGNLIDNAIRYGLAARVSLAHSDGYAIIRIEDDGPGIPAERMMTVFEPFVRGDESRNSETGGAGLGLSIARSIVRAHGGTIELHNRKPSGLLACVYLPMTE
ncbi:ATP-binding protein [Granulosicoccus antarcticus]|uniref:ATP-binding protein n=1 Tax=Granulosicoccus antarcticus TaxID=437505 RepID=UPI00146FA5EE|nr:ATP-binding protein [Granulosicoccus antarcticus]